MAAIKVDNFFCFLLGDIVSRLPTCQRTNSNLNGNWVTCLNNGNGNRFQNSFVATLNKNIFRVY